MTTILITGATSGIGRAYAEEFAKAGNNLIIASRNTAKMEQVKKELEAKYHNNVTIYTVDLQNDSGAEELFKFCQDKKVDILVNNSGFGLHALPQVDQPLQEVKDLLSVNVRSLVILSTLFGQEMKKRKAGYILNVASTAAFQPMPFAALYGASKAFVLSFSEAMATELGPDNVGVTAVCPGITDTNFFKYGKPRLPGWLYKLVSPELVVQRSIKAMYQKKLYIVPYFQHWLIAQISRFLPRQTVVDIMKLVEKRRKGLKN